MTNMRLGAFITSNMEPILCEWERFATTIVPPALTMDSVALRDHARLMLEAIAIDLGNEQSDQQAKLKSHGHGRLLTDESAAEIHAAQRLFSGFTIEQLVAEYRALRASVLSLWADNAQQGLATDPRDVMRFNEGIDQAIAESVSRYAQMVSTSQHLFLAILGHDLRNPLATTLMASSFIMQSSEVDDKYTVAANRIYNAGQRMNRLVNDLIDYSRSNLGSNLPIILKDANLETLCREAIAEQQQAHPERSFALHAQGDCHGRWDDNRIAQVLSNLLGNAVQHGAQGEQIVVRLTPADSELVLRVESRGKLIPPEHINTVFEPLVRLAGDNETPLAQGTSMGIGLYIVKQIVIAHGGAITVTSTEQEGTVFALTLPRRPPGDVRQQWLSPAPASRTD